MLTILALPAFAQDPHAGMQHGPAAPRCPIGRSGAVFWRLESTPVETDVLRTGVPTFQGGRKSAHIAEEGRRDFVGAVSFGATRMLLRPVSWDLAAGGMVTAYAVPAALSPFYGTQPPWSFQIFSVCGRPPCTGWSTWS